MVLVIEFLLIGKKNARLRVRAINGYVSPCSHACVYGAPFSHLFTELKISLIEVHISAIELEISPIHLKISSNQLEISTIRPI